MFKQALAFLPIFVTVSAQAAFAESPGDSPRLDSRLESFLSSKDGAPARLWVYFRDHGEANGYDLSAMLDRVEISPRAAKRRQMRNGDALPGPRDLAICADYLMEIRALGARIRHRSKYFNAVSVVATPDQAREILRLPFVRRVGPVRKATRPYTGHSSEPVRPFRKMAGLESDSAAPTYETLADSVYGLSDIQLNQINVPPLHDEGYHGEGILIAMLDTGFGTYHDAFEHLNVAAEWDFINHDGYTGDEFGDVNGQMGHGTLSLGVIASYLPGIIMGPAWAADYAFAKTERLLEEIEIEEDDWVRGLEWADSLGADVVSSSLGYFQWYRFPDLDGNTAVSTRAADIAASRGILVVTAAGNDGPVIPWPGINVPGDADSVVTVGMVNKAGKVLDASSQGPTYDGRIKPDVVALGRLVATVNWQTINRPGVTGGTSASTPLVAGACALILQKRPHWSPMQVLEALRATASHADDPNNEHGWGIIDAYAASNIPDSRISVFFDVRPGACVNPLSPASRGVLPTLLLGSTDFDVRDVDLGSVRLQGSIAPIQTKVADIASMAGMAGRPCAEMNPDGFADLALKFPASEVVVDLGVAARGDTFSLRVTGELFDGTPFEGGDVVTIVGGGRSEPLADESRAARFPTRLGTARPNPFNPTTRVTFSLAREERVTLAVYDTEGKRVALLADRRFPAGNHSLVWNARSHASGVYFLRLETNTVAETSKLILLK